MGLEWLWGWSMAVGLGELWGWGRRSTVGLDVGLCMLPWDAVEHCGAGCGSLWAFIHYCGTLRGTVGLAVGLCGVAVGVRGAALTHPSSARPRAEIPRGRAGAA